MTRLDGRAARGAYGRTIGRGNLSLDRRGGRLGLASQLGLDLGHGLAAARAEHDGLLQAVVAKRTIDECRSIGRRLRLALELVDLGLKLRTLHIDRGDAVIELLAALTQLGVVLGHLVQAGTQLTGELLATLEGIVHLALEFVHLQGTAGICRRTVERRLHLIKKTHGVPFYLGIGHHGPSQNAPIIAQQNAACMRDGVFQQHRYAE